MFFVANYQVLVSMYCIIVHTIILTVDTYIQILTCFYILLFEQLVSCGTKPRNLVICNMNWSNKKLEDLQLEFVHVQRVDANFMCIKAFL